MKKENQVKVADAILLAFSTYKKEVEDSQADAIAVEKKEIPKPEVAVETKSTSPATEKSGVSKEGMQTSTDPKQAEVKKVVPPRDHTKPSYRIQIAASSKPSLDSKYTSLDDLEVVKEKDLYKFLVGNFNTYDEALPRLASLKASGFAGCFIVVYKDGQRIRA
jgi:N-acetylmuramoyl-L-alanine amidase